MIINFIKIDVLKEEDFLKEMLFVLKRFNNFLENLSSWQYKKDLHDECDQYHLKNMKELFFKFLNTQIDEKENVNENFYKFCKDYQNDIFIYIFAPSNFIFHCFNMKSVTKILNNKTKNFKNDLLVSLEYEEIVNNMIKIENGEFLTGVFYSYQQKMILNLFLNKFLFFCFFENISINTKNNKENFLSIYRDILISNANCLHSSCFASIRKLIELIVYIKREKKTITECIKKIIEFIRKDLNKNKNENEFIKLFKNFSTQKDWEKIKTYTARIMQNESHNNFFSINFYKMQESIASIKIFKSKKNNSKNCINQSESGKKSINFIYESLIYIYKSFLEQNSKRNSPHARDELLEISQNLKKIKKNYDIAISDANDLSNSIFFSFEIVFRIYENPNIFVNYILLKEKKINQKEYEYLLQISERRNFIFF